MSSAASGTIVAFGDSITDGRCSTNEGDNVIPDRYQRWTDVLAARLATLPAAEIKGIVNEGIEVIGLLLLAETVLRGSSDWSVTSSIVRARRT